MQRSERPSTVAELRKSRYKVVTVKQEIRNHLIKKIKKGEQLFPKIVGFEDSVIPHLENAILAGQDIILLGERGQAKSRLIRHIASLLDDEIPVIAGCELPVGAHGGRSGAADAEIRRCVTDLSRNHVIRFQCLGLRSR